MRLNSDNQAGKVILCPAIEYGQFSCTNTRYRILESTRPLVVLALPDSWSQPLREAVGNFPEYSYLSFKRGSFAVHPLNPFIEALRTVDESRLPHSFLGYFPETAADDYSHYVEDTLLRSMGAEKYLHFRCGDPELLKQGFLQLLPADLDLDGAQSIIIVFSPLQAAPFREGIQSLRAPRRARLNPINREEVTRHLDEWPYIIARHQEKRNIYHPRDWFIRQLLIETAEKHHAALNPRQLLKIEQYGRNITYQRTDGLRWTPTLENLLTACEEIVDRDYARAVMERALRYRGRRKEEPVDDDPFVAGRRLFKWMISLIREQRRRRKRLKEKGGSSPDRAGRRRRVSHKSGRRKKGAPGKPVGPPTHPGQSPLEERYRMIKDSLSRRRKSLKPSRQTGERGEKPGPDRRDSYNETGTPFPRYRWDMMDPRYWEKKIPSGSGRGRRSKRFRRRQRSNPDFKKERVMRFTLENFFRMVFSSREAVVEEFISGLKDGINVRETVRDIERSRLFVNNLPKEQLKFHGMVIETEDVNRCRHIGGFSGNFLGAFLYTNMKQFTVKDRRMWLNKWGLLCSSFQPRPTREDKIAWGKRFQRQPPVPDRLKEEYFSRCRGKNIIYITPEPLRKAEQASLKKQGIGIFHLPLSAVPRKCIEDGRVFTWTTLL